jgi:DNA topoisomerase-1
MIQIGETESEEKPRFAPMPEGRKIADVTLEEALKMFELPRVVGKSAKGEKIVANIGRFGPYLKVGNVNISIKNYDPFNITEKEANMLIAEREEKLKKMVITDFKEAKIRILNGRFGPYITDGKTNVKIPKGTDPKKISLKEAERLISEKKK